MAIHENNGPQKSLMKVVDLFAGCGGMSQGFQNAGLNVIAAFEKWKPAVGVYKANFDHDVFEVDLSEPKSREQIAGLQPDVIIGGPPCQDYSSAGRRNFAEEKTNHRASLTTDFAEIVLAVRPRWYVMENVDLTLKSPTYNKAKAMLAKAGYGITLKVLDASHYGVPQARKRLFQIGELHGQHDGLSSYLDCKITTERCTVRQYWEQQGWSQLEFEHYYRHPRTYGRRGVFSIDESSQTIREVNRPIPPTYTAHKGDTEDPATGQVGVYTTKQRSLIQTFSPDFNINGVTKTDAEVMIGNAVPVKLAEFVAGCILQYESDKKHNTASVSRQLAFAYGVTPQKEVSSTHQKRRSNSPHAHSSF